jgi:hypothetical protein
MDCRDLAALTGKWYKSINEKKRVALVELPCEDGCEYCGGGNCEEELEVSIKFIVCQVCNGTGKHVNPSIDSHGITSEEFHEDPDFEEDYFSGVYDVTCYKCNGLRVIPDIDEDKTSKEIVQRYLNYVDELAKDATERAYVQRMGF